MINPSYNPDLPLLQQYQRAVVVGLGATGFSAVNYLQARGLDVSVLDDRQSPPFANQLADTHPDVALIRGDFKFTDIDKSALLVLSPGVPVSHPVIRQAKESGIKIVSDIQLFVEENDKPLLAITGSNGKSTVTTLVGLMCEKGGLKPWVAGNIGTPALDALSNAVDYDVAVLELSSFQLEISDNLHADCAAILNISPDHLDRYESMGDYVLAKTRILKGAKKVVLPRHDEYLAQLSISDDDLSTFELDEPTIPSEFGIRRLSNYRCLLQGDNTLMKLRDVPLTGLHNIKNVLAAFAIVQSLNLEKQALIDAVQDFNGLPHRMQTVLVKDGVTWVNDSKATNIGATSTALLGIEKPMVWIAGGQGKGADFTELRNAISSQVRALIVFGEDAALLSDAVKDRLDVYSVSDLPAAVSKAKSLIEDGSEKDSLVLFSPACASFDMFDNYEHRGQAFMNAVSQLASMPADNTAKGASL